MGENATNKVGLVLEGGTFRGVYSAGVMDAFLENGVEFPYIIGVSAGISNGVSYVSKQFARNREIMDKYRSDKRYIGARNFRICKSCFGLDFVFDEIPNKLVPFNYDTFYKYKGELKVGVTNAATGKFECKNGLENGTDFKYLRASCSIPGLFPPAELDGNFYYDGGLSCPIPIKPAIKDGCMKNVIILTQPEGFVKKCGKGNIIMSQLIRKRFPEIEMLLLDRHRIYNRQTEFCRELERRGKALIFRPKIKLDSLEKSTEKLHETWQMGYNDGTARIEEVKAFIGTQYDMYN